eukprot:CAMPEP_0116064042 /NCGR_PEP_ID=MMETSP0322-20121206/8841_1 /TAXON_ID=163516 /ORGANISM="Leptocylindrus danicus var. apora, Strain B651" /LENGTH=425 /DNA_ID=CAMNT_0003549909 /DNA_START=28 /DNA_END=1305 /DNA_ORIENTATION=-
MRQFHILIALTYSNFAHGRYLRKSTAAYEQQQIEIDEYVDPFLVQQANLDAKEEEESKPDTNDELLTVDELEVEAELLLQEPKLTSQDVLLTDEDIDTEAKQLFGEESFEGNSRNIDVGFKTEDQLDAEVDKMFSISESEDGLVEVQEDVLSAEELEVAASMLFKSTSLDVETDSAVAPLVVRPGAKVSSTIGSPADVQVSTFNDEVFMAQESVLSSEELIDEANLLSTFVQSENAKSLTILGNEDGMTEDETIMSKMGMEFEDEINTAEDEISFADSGSSPIIVGPIAKVSSTIGSPVDVQPSDSSEEIFMAQENVLSTEELAAEASILSAFVQSENAKNLSFLGNEDGMTEDEAFYANTSETGMEFEDEMNASEDETSFASSGSLPVIVGPVAKINSVIDDPLSVAANGVRIGPASFRSKTGN